MHINNSTIKKRLRSFTICATASLLLALFAISVQTPQTAQAATGSRAIGSGQFGPQVHAASGDSSSQTVATPATGSDSLQSRGLAPNPPKPQYDLQEAVHRALSENFSILAAEENLQSSESWRKAVRGTFGPSLDTSYGYTHSQHSDDDLYSWRVALTQDVFSGFSTLASYQKAALQRDSATASLAKARLDLILTVQQNFFAYLKAVEDVRSAQDSYNRLAEQLRVTSSFYNVGLRPHLDVLQAEANLSEAEDVLLRANNSVEIQRVRLNTLLNLPLDSQPEYIGQLDFIPFTGSLDQCLEQAYRQRPDINMALKSIDIAQQDKTSAASGFYPKIQGELAWATQGDQWSADGNDNRPTKYSEWSVKLTGNLNLFKWGNTYYDVQQNSHNIARLRAEEADLRQEVAYQVQSRLLELDNAAKRILVARKGLAQASEAYRVASARYRSQVGTSIDVLDAQATLTAAEASLTGAQADYLSALAATYNAIGEESPGLSAAQ
ncbi:TolC family protein [Desulfovibrio sp. OttesenSCG-928-C06]|nr:TolC family protein [Desulfovibrio sp. OttesenSCG-928-C06]